MKYCQLNKNMTSADSLIPKFSKNLFKNKIKEFRLDKFSISLQKIEAFSLNYENTDI